MYHWFGKSRYTPIGLDLGSRVMKLAQMRRRGERLEVTALARIELPAHPSDPEARIAAERDALREILTRGQFRGRQVVMTLGAQQLFVQNVRLPRLASDELLKVARWETDERLPEEFGPAEMRHLVAGEIRPGGNQPDAEPRQEIILLAARRNDVDTLIGLAETARLQPVAIDLAPCSLVRTYQSLLRRKSDEQCGLLFIEVGATSTTLVFTRGTDILLIKPLPIGGQSFDNAVARRLVLEPPAAANVRRQSEAADGSIGGDAVLTIADAVRGEIENLATELAMCVRYHNVTFRGNRLARAILLGGEASDTLAGHLGRRIEIPCEVGDPLLGCDVAPQLRHAGGIGRRSQWALAIGLCMKTPARAA